MLSKNLFIHLLFKVKPVSLRANCRTSLLPQKNEENLNAMTNVSPNGAERSLCLHSTPACLSVNAGFRKPNCSFMKPNCSFGGFQSVTRWRPRSQRAAEGASCLGGEGRKPVPSGRYLAYGGSPASSASEGTSGDPEKTFGVVSENARCLFTFCNEVVHYNKKQTNKKPTNALICLNSFTSFFSGCTVRILGKTAKVTSLVFTMIHFVCVSWFTRKHEWMNE